jgi:peptidyl-tRNA hydrolase
MPIEPNPYDRPDLLDLRKDQEDPLVLYLIVRESLNMGAGKIAAQIAHGMGMFDGRFAYMVECIESESQPEIPEAWRAKVDITKEWLATSYRKVVLKADDKEWEKVKAELPVFLVKDAGLTEVASGSETVLITWPMKKSLVPKCIKRLQVLK